MQTIKTVAAITAILVIGAARLAARAASHPVTLSASVAISGIAVARSVRAKSSVNVTLDGVNIENLGHTPAIHIHDTNAGAISASRVSLRKRKGASDAR